MIGKHGDRVLIMDSKEPLPGAWQVGAEETWRLMGGTPAAFRRAASDGAQEETLAAWAIRSATPHLAEAMIEEALAQLEHSRGEQREGKAGVCSIGREDAAWARLKSWLKACKACPQDPRGQMAADRRAEEQDKCGMLQPFQPRGRENER